MGFNSGFKGLKGQVICHESAQALPFLMSKDSEA